MDVAGPASTGRTLIRSAGVVLLFILWTISSALGQTSDDASLAAKAKQLTSEERWEDVVALVASSSPRSAELDFYYGTALAHLERWEAAREALLSGARVLPQDKRFPVELAGVAFKQKRYTEAAHYLHRALALDPNDEYANDFLATVYFIQENLEAALKYWNRAGKPQIAAIHFDPQPRLDPVLLDHALMFSPASVLKVSDFLKTESRVQGLGVFSSHHFEVLARDDGKFDAIFHGSEQNGFGKNKWEALVRLFRNLPSQSIHPEYFNYRQEGINIISAYRWDAQKRRVYLRVSGPWRHEPKRRWQLGTQVRGENWDIRSSSKGNVPVLGSFNMRREAVSAEVRSFSGGRWGWIAGAEVSHRDFRDIFAGSILTPSLLAKGYQLKQITGVNVDLLRIPEKRMTVSGTLTSEAGRLWSESLEGFEKFQGGVLFHWYPQAVGDDYEVQYQVRAGKTWGDPPFDELFTLGGLGDNNLTMRGHITTHGGRKGSGPLGRNYFLSNWELDKNVYHNGLVGVKVGPFLDTGKITDPSPGFGSHKWLWDTGGQVKLKALGIGMALCYGRDLRSGNDAVFVTMLW